MQEITVSTTTKTSVQNSPGTTLLLHYQAQEPVSVCSTNSPPSHAKAVPTPTLPPSPVQEVRLGSCREWADPCRWLSLGDFALLTRKAENGEIGLLNFCGRILHSSQTHSDKRP